MKSSDLTRRIKAFWQDINAIQWIPGIKHPLTPMTIFKNVWLCDQIRRNTPTRCMACNFVIPTDEMKSKELVFACDPAKCTCRKPYQMGLVSHRVCDVCDGMYRAIYVNWGMQNRNYFKDLDDEDKRLKGGDARRRMGLDD